MTIQIPYRGIIEIVADHDVGKTIAALQTSNNMKDVVFVDDDVKGEGTVRQMKVDGMEFDLYIDLAEARAKLGQAPTADELLQYVVLPTIEKITEKKRKVIIWDTWRIVYQSARGHVEKNQSKYKDVVNFSRGTSAMIQGLMSKVARMIEVKILNELKSSCDLLIITHHIKDHYVSNVIAGKIPESSSTFSEVCNMRMWLRRNYQSKVPIILFLKRPNVPKMVGNKLRFQNIVPLKITPTDKHQSIWDAVAEYEKDPIESRMPNESETPTEEELAAISGTLTTEQKNLVKAMIEYNKQLESDLVDVTEQEAESAPTEMSEVMRKLVGSQQERPGTTQQSKPDTFPGNAIQLLAKAKSELGMSLEDIETVLGKSFAQINETFKSDYWLKLLEEHNGTIARAVGGKNAKPKSKTKK